jgi:hypothetical protein
MKKVIFVLFLLLLLLGLASVFPAKTSAVGAIKCGLKSMGHCENMPVSCSVEEKVYCCETEAECTLLKDAESEAPRDPTCDYGKGINTAIGCIPILGANGQADFLSFILRWAVGIGGGIAFLLILYGGFMVMSSSGDPERLKAGQELITSALAGLILLIFSVFILKFIGVDILGLCRFGFGTCENIFVQ